MTPFSTQKERDSIQKFNKSMNGYIPVSQAMADAFEALRMYNQRRIATMSEYRGGSTIIVYHIYRPVKQRIGNSPLNGQRLVDHCQDGFYCDSKQPSSYDILCRAPAVERYDDIADIALVPCPTCVAARKEQQS